MGLIIEDREVIDNRRAT